MAKRSKGSTVAQPPSERDWQRRNDLDTLRRAGEVMRDKARMREAQREAKDQMSELQKVVGKTRGPGLGFAKG